MRQRLLLLLMLMIGITVHAQKASISGKVVQAKNNEPIPFAAIGIQGTTWGAAADDKGNFIISNIQPGLYNVECSAIGYKKSVQFEVEVTVDRPAFIQFKLESDSELGALVFVDNARQNQEESPLSVRSIGTNEIKRNPGGNRDISKVIRTLPGVAAIPSFRNDIIIRGGAANENRFYIDGIEIPNINHFATQGASGGPVGMINVDLIREVDFYAGAFPAARGNALSSVMEFQFKDARRDKTTANFIVGSSDLGVTVETPTGKNAGLNLSIRRSYLQLLFAALELPFLPAYNDYNLKWKWDINEKNALTIISLGALDQFELNLGLDDDTASENFVRNKYLLDNLVVNEQWNYTFGAKWDHYFELGKLSLIASRNMLQNDAYKYLNNDNTQLRTFDYSSAEQENKFRLEYRLDNGPWKFVAGTGAEYAVYDNFSKLHIVDPFNEALISLGYQSNYNLIKYGGFLQTSRNWWNNRIIVSAGARIDGNNFGKQMQNPLEQFSPRASLRVGITPSLTFNANTGIYYQQPSYLSLGYQVNDVFVNQSMRFVRNRQIVAGFQYDLPQRNSKCSVEAFHKYYQNYPQSILNGVSLANLGADFGTVGNEALTSTGLGRSYGLEFLYQQRLYKGFYGILSYTYVRSEFTSTNGKWSPSSWDSRNLISLTAGKKFGNNWEVGAVFRYSGGLPYTPDNEQLSMQRTIWDALRFAVTDWSQLNTQRIKPFHQLDIRIDRKWFFTKWSLDLFLDIQNTLNAQTPLKPILDVKRDALGNPVVDPNDPTRYLPNYLDNSSGSLIPSIGIIVEL
jgi:hypothetical protein